jgi:predicted O-linked N-acetylglucosamine transferase (SPINDLY family)
MAGTSDERFAQRIADSAIDIAIDLKGHTGDARLGVLALRPAPLQCHYLGFPGTLGAEVFDYLIADPVVAPEGCEPHFTEHLVRLPDTYQVNDRRRTIAEPGPSRAACGLPDGGVVLCCFNGQQKLAPPMLDLFVRVALAVPDSVLWLYCDHALAARNLAAEVAARGLDPARLVIAGKLPPAEHLARQRHADLFLDTQPYGAHTTCSDALWVGLPVLTSPTRAFAGRVAASLLTAIGMPELIATDLGDYEAKAIALARDRTRLATLRQRLIVARETAPLFDTDRFRRNLEAAYVAMWERRRQGLPPAPIDVHPDGKAEARQPPRAWSLDAGRRP